MFCLVAPYVGAWIETYKKRLYKAVFWVAPYVGAWIETFEGKTVGQQNMSSHPTWVRGLKPRYMEYKTCIDKSHPTWVRGLKQKNQERLSYTQVVAPYVGAWIETAVNRKKHGW